MAWLAARDATPEQFLAQTRRGVADLALEAALAKRHDQGKEGVPQLASHHAQQMGDIINVMIKQPTDTAEIRIRLKLRQQWESDHRE